MKATFKVSGQIEIPYKDLLPIISNYIEETYGYPIAKLQRSKDADKIIAIIDHTKDGGAQRMDTQKKAKTERRSNEGFSRRWMGFYPTIQEIVEEAKAKKKTYLDFDDLYEQLLSTADVKGHPKFIRNGEPIEPSRVKQYLSPSQLAKTPQTKGMKWDKKNQRLLF